MIVTLWGIGKPLIVSSDQPPPLKASGGMVMAFSMRPTPGDLTGTWMGAPCKITFMGGAAAGCWMGVTRR